MSLEIGTAIESLVFWKDNLRKKKGPIVFDIGVYKHMSWNDEVPPGGESTDIIVLGEEGKEIVLADFIEFLQEVKEKADQMTTHGTYWYGGFRKPYDREKKLYDTNVDFKISWST